MKRIAAAAALACAGLAPAQAASPLPGQAGDAAGRPSLLLVGDSTLAPRTGYGHALCERVAPALACLNLARGGRSTKSYRAEGLWDEVLARLRSAPAGQPHWVLIQFGHNDQPGKPGRSTDLASEFPANLARYVNEVRAAGALPLLATPLARRSFHDGLLKRDLQAWADTTRRIALEMDVPLLDLYRLSADAVQALGQAGADELAMAPPPPPGQPASGASAGFDRTHLGPRGACLFAGLMVDELATKTATTFPQLAAALQAGPPCHAIPAPAPAPAAAPAAPAGGPGHGPPR